MAGQIEAFLLGSREGVSADTLKTVAMDVARGYIQKQASLNEAIASKADELGLNKHQVERVATAANTLVFRHKFANDESKVVEFPIAQPAVIADLRGRPKQASYTPRETSLPQSEYIPGLPSGADWRGPRAAREKVANAVTGYRPAGDFTAPLRNLSTRLAGEAELLEGEVHASRVRVRNAGDALVKEAQLVAARREGTLYDMVDALSQVARSPGLLKEATQLLVSGLRRTDAVVADGHEKQASRTADPAHPLLQAYTRFENELVTLEARTRASQEVRGMASLAKVASYTAMGVQDAREKSAGKVSDFFRSAGKRLGLLEEFAEKSVTPKVNYTHASLLEEAKKVRGAGASNADLAAEMKNIAAVRGPQTEDVFSPGHRATKFGKGLAFAGTAAGGLAGAHTLAQVVDKAKETASAKKNLRKAVEYNPDLKRLDPTTLKRHFNVLQTFAPDMAGEPTAAGSFLRQSAQRGDIGIDPSTIKTLADLQKAHSDGAGSKGQYSGALRALALPGLGGA